MLVWLVSTLIAAFVLELVLLSPWLGNSGAGIVNRLTLTIPGLQHGHLWTLVTHGLLHSTGNPFHILFTILMLVFIGRELEPLLGARRFLAVFVAAIALGAIAWAAVNWVHGGVLIGAGAAVLGLFVVLAILSPQMEMSLFLIPVTFRPKHLIYVLLALDGFGLLFYEIMGASPPLGLNPSAHLGGMLAGWLYCRFLHANQGWDRAPGFTLPAWLRRGPKQAASTLASAVTARKASPQLRAEVDRILDKINSEGFGALTAEEKRSLDEAKDLLSRP